VRNNLIYQMYKGNIVRPRSFHTKPQGSVASFLGDRECNDDSYVHSDDFLFSAVFDGHGGGNVSGFLREFYNKTIIEEIIHLTSECEYDEAQKLVESLVRADNDQNLVKVAHRSGSTAALLLLFRTGDNYKFITAYLGNSRIVVGRAGSIATDLSVDHNPNMLRERLRVERLGGKVEWDGPVELDGSAKIGGRGRHRIGALAMSRAIGKICATSWREGTASLTQIGYRNYLL